MWVCMLVGGVGGECRVHGLVGGSLRGWGGGGLLGRHKGSRGGGMVGGGQGLW